MLGKLIRKGSTARHGSVYLKSQYEALIVGFKLAWATQLRHSQNLKRRHGWNTRKQLLDRDSANIFKTPNTQIACSRDFVVVIVLQMEKKQTKTRWLPTGKGYKLVPPTSSSTGLLLSLIPIKKNKSIKARREELCCLPGQFCLLLQPHGYGLCPPQRNITWT